MGDEAPDDDGGETDCRGGLGDRIDSSSEESTTFSEDLKPMRLEDILTSAKEPKKIRSLVISEIKPQAKDKAAMNLTTIS